MRLNRLTVFPVCWAALVATSPVASALDTLVMPRELADIAQSSGCTMISDFYERAGMVGPPFVYGVFHGEPEDSAAFWCKRSPTDDPTYLLVVKASDPKALCGCPPTIEWRNFPGGLSVEVRAEVNLDQFRFVKDPARSGPPQQITDGRFIVSYYDGLTEVFYCHKGAWLYATTE